MDFNEKRENVGKTYREYRNENYIHSLDYLMSELNNYNESVVEEIIIEIKQELMNKYGFTSVDIDSLNQKLYEIGQLNDLNLNVENNKSCNREKILNNIDKNIGKLLKNIETIILMPEYMSSTKYRRENQAIFSELQNNVLDIDGEENRYFRKMFMEVVELYKRYFKANDKAILKLSYERLKCGKDRTEGVIKKKRKEFAKTNSVKIINKYESNIINIIDKLENEFENIIQTLKISKKDENTVKGEQSKNIIVKKTDENADKSKSENNIERNRHINKEFDIEEIYIEEMTLKLSNGEERTLNIVSNSITIEELMNLLQQNKSNVVLNNEIVNIKKTNKN